ncbi:MAG: DUF4338 domain-containing protein [Thermodesulfobacteriota bacterium]|nr:DUF4338 domain-containing protein [Thermodesulfobacteriota bacterium]
MFHTIMKTLLTLQGRQLTADDLFTIRNLITTHPDWHRTRISQELCRRWRWMNDKGRLKDIAARSLLRKLDSMGLIELPAPVRSANNEFRNQSVVLELSSQETTAIECRLSELQPLRIHRVKSPEDTLLFRGLLQQHHYLGYTGPVGENIQYLIHDHQNSLLGCMLYGAAAWQVADRDQFIGWDEVARKRGLSRIANNMRFLILPWVRVPHLASHLLAATRRRLSKDWQEKYGHTILLLETFVEQDRFAGTCYQADNWIRVGKTRGRSRNHNSGDPTVPVKSVWLYPLCREFRQELTVPTMDRG